MITFSNKTKNGNFQYSNEALGIVINGSYSLNDSNDLISINMSFGSTVDTMNGSLNGYNPGNDKMSFSINIVDADFILLGKALSVYNDIIQSIKNNNSNEAEED